GPRPPPRPPWRTRNDDSVVIALRYGEVSLLLTGDVEAKGEAVLDTPRGFALKGAHHGSRSSSSAGVLCPAAPRVAGGFVGGPGRRPQPVRPPASRSGRALRPRRCPALPHRSRRRGDAVDRRRACVDRHVGRRLGGPYSLICVNIRALPAFRSRPVPLREQG